MSHYFTIFGTNKYMTISSKIENIIKQSEKGKLIFISLTNCLINRTADKHVVENIYSFYFTVNKLKKIRTKKLAQRVINL